MLPATTGIGFKPQHFSALRAERKAVGFIEVHAENYMGDGGLPHAQLADLRRDFPLSLHGVGLSLGGMTAPDHEHLQRLRTLCDRYEADSFSEHLAWSSHGGTYFADLLPLPYTEATLARLIDHVDQTQHALGRRMLLENPATYVEFAASTIPEPEFLAAIAAATGCGLLLDVNNVYVACTNRGADPKAWLDALPPTLIGQIHLAGHDATIDALGAPLLIDHHGAAVADPVWALFDHVLAGRGPLPTLIEWDTDVPTWPVLQDEAQRAQAKLDGAAERAVAA